MAKKKSKTQKYKKNVKRKAKKILVQTAELKLEKPSKVTSTNNIIEENINIQNPSKNISKIKKIEKVPPTPKKDKNNDKSETAKLFNKSNNKKQSNEKIDLPKLNKNQKKQDNIQKNIFIRLLYELKHNSHIIFNSLIIIIFIIMLIGLFRIEIISIGQIAYIAAIALFLIAVAISYNKYISGKIFTVILCIIMSFIIYKMQYTYDFVRNLNFNLYEYKTYYVVTFDSPQNKSVYNLNNKKIGLLKDNCVNIERRLNTKLDKVNYVEYDNVNELFNSFYSREFRAILVNENQYKYLENNIENDQDIKILYEFKANAKK